MLATVKQNGNSLRHAATELRVDMKVVLVALKQNWNSFRYAAPELEVVNEIVFVAVNRMEILPDMQRRNSRLTSRLCPLP